eukprot:TRINITY_DN404_c0_g2_i1.p1 TRINITY_DN404_c0_g2~~TRINITY_DN404_c0_g2_i1.p1  ORF type:complete len:307 (-),score=85.93 TRINITY_DN404_c0_g2_i1:581-1501(-)
MHVSRLARFAAPALVSLPKHRTRGAGLAAAASITGAAFLCSSVVSADEKSAGPLSPAEFRAFTVRNVQALSHNTSRIVLDLPADQSLQLSIASCVVIRAPGVGEEGKDVIRPYTPVTTNRDLGHFDFVIKKYRNGKSSGYVTSLRPGDKLEVKGPFVKIQYSPNWKKHVGMIAGGTGITPMFQVLKEALENPADQAQYTLVFGNTTEGDILLKPELDALAAKHSNFKVHYIVSKPSATWTGLTGHINADIIKKYMPDPTDSESIVFVCGPPPMVKAISGDKKGQDQGELAGALKDLGYQAANVFKF